MHDPQHGVYGNNSYLINPDKPYFSLSGKEISKKQLGKYIGCLGFAKVFLYLAKKFDLTASGVITTSLETLKPIMKKIPCLFRLKGMCSSEFKQIPTVSFYMTQP